MSQTKYCFSLKVKRFAPPKQFRAGCTTGLGRQEIRHLGHEPQGGDSRKETCFVTSRYFSERLTRNKPFDDHYKNNVNRNHVPRS